MFILQGNDKSLRPPPHKSAKLVDSGGGFFIDEQEQENDKRDNIKFVEGPGRKITYVQIRESDY